MKNTLLQIGLSLNVLLVVGCSSSPTRESNPDKFDLLKTGQINKANISNFKTCLVKGSEVKNRIAYNIKTKLQISDDGYKVESYAGDVLLLLSIDIFSSGKTQIFRAKNSELTDLSQQIRAFDRCLSEYK